MASSSNTNEWDSINDPNPQARRHNDERRGSEINSGEQTRSTHTQTSLTANEAKSAQTNL